MRNAFIIALLLSLSGCAATQQAAVERTKHDLAERGLTLPNGYRVEVKEGFELISHTYRGDLWYLWFISYNAHGKPLYRYTIERYSGKIREFEVMRKNRRSAVKPNQSPQSTIKG